MMMHTDLAHYYAGLASQTVAEESRLLAKVAPKKRIKEAVDHKSAYLILSDSCRHLAQFQVPQSRPYLQSEVRTWPL